MAAGQGAGEAADRRTRCNHTPPWSGDYQVNAPTILPIVSRPTEETVKARSRKLLNDLREDGHSRRYIAGALDVSTSTVDTYFAERSDMSLTTWLNGCYNFNFTFGCAHARLVGLEMRPLFAVPSCPDQVSANLAAFLAAYLDKKRGGLTPKEKCDIADQLRDLLPELNGLVDEADRIRGVS